MDQKRNGVRSGGSRKSEAGERIRKGENGGRRAAAAAGGAGALLNVRAL